MSFSLDFLKLLGDELYHFPRKLMTNTSSGQITVYDERDILELARKADFLDCFIQTHTAMDQQRSVLRVIFIDIDFKGDLERAKKVTERILRFLKKSYGIEPYVQFSGFKGYHILIPIKEVMVPDGHAKDFLAFLQVTFSKGYCDPQLLGDIVRLWRIPYTYNSKGVINDLEGNGLVTPIEEWNGKHFDVEELWYEFQIAKLGEQLKARKQPRPQRYFRNHEGLRAEVSTLIEQAKQGINLTHRQRLAILFETINRGFSDDQIHAIFSAIPDYDLKKMQCYIEHARKRGYKSFRTETLRRVIEL